jgi:hypothetical protein
VANLKQNTAGNVILHALVFLAAHIGNSPFDILIDLIIKNRVDKEASRYDTLKL